MLSIKKWFSLSLIHLMVFGITAQELPNQNWTIALSHGPEALAAFYLDTAYHVDPDGSYLQGPAAIADWWARQDFEIDSVKTVQLATPHLVSYRYEIAQLYMADGSSCSRLAIWNLQGPTPRLELEITGSVGAAGAISAQLDVRRQLWMDHCNAHRVTELVTEVYAPNALYYNHRPMITGRETIINTYQYMAYPNYSLHLEPLSLQPVNEALVFEIGQCSGSYRGKYMLVWVKDDSGLWQILLDSNI